MSAQPPMTPAQPRQHEAGADETLWKQLTCSTESSPRPKGKLIIFIPAGVLTSLPLLPLPLRQTFAHQIQLSLAQSERLCTLKVKVRRSQGQTLEPSSFQTGKDVGFTWQVAWRNQHSLESRTCQGDGVLAMWHTGVDDPRGARRECPSELVPVTV